jgi:serine O-acetyltransferase
MRQSTKPQVVQAIDPVWDRMRREAEDIARKEPVLGGFIFSAVLNHNTFERALVHRLAQRLGSVDLSAELVVQAFEDAMDEEPEIGFAARADIIATFERDPACHRYGSLLYFKGFQACRPTTWRPAVAQGAGLSSICKCSQFPVSYQPPPKSARAS